VDNIYRFGFLYLT